MTFTVLLEYYYWLQNPNIANVFFSVAGSISSISFIEKYNKTI